MSEGPHKTTCVSTRISPLTVNRLPFLRTPDIALGIAVKTFLGEISPSDSAEARQKTLNEFPSNFVPNAINFAEDLDTSLNFFDALIAGVETINAEMTADDKAAWRAAKQYRDSRRL